MKVVLSIEALSDKLTGIGRYTMELAKRLEFSEFIRKKYFYRSGRISRSLSQAFPVRKRSRLRRYSGLDNIEAYFAMHGSLFHGPNFFLPDKVEGGIVTIHDLSVFKFPETHPVERIRVFEEKFQSTLSRTAHIVTDCDFVRKELLDWFGLPPRAVTAVPLGVTDHYRPRTPDEFRPVLHRVGLRESGFALCVATYEPRKRVASAIAAHSYARRRWNIPPLVLVGAPGWSNSELAEHIKTAEVLGDVISLGYVEENDLPALYSGAGLFLFPSIYEGFGLPPIEAMASGVPTIVANRSCLPEVTRGASMLVDPDDVEGFAESIRRGFEDDNWRLEAVTRGRAVAAIYTWDRCFDDILAVYGRVWSERG